MAKTYTQIYLHIVFAVSARACAISPARREELQKFITGIVTRKGQKLIAIYCMPDHTHVHLGLKPNIAPSDLIGDIKTGSTKSHQRAAMDRLSFFLAGRLRRVFRLSFAP
jgi:putative transposase